MQNESIEFTNEYLQKIQQFNIKLRKAALGTQSGIHKSIRRGHGLEFSELRPYSPGDDFRSIDWNALARTDKMYTRLYREEQDLKVLVVLDHSKSLEQISSARMIALSLCYISLCAGDSVSLLLPGIDQHPWVRSPKVFKKIISFVSDRSYNDNTELFLSVSKAASNLKVPAKLFIISDFLYDLVELEKTLEYATRKNFEVSLIIINNEKAIPNIIDGILVDAETNQEYSTFLTIDQLKEEVNKHIASLEELVRYFGQQSMVVSSLDSIDEIMFNQLPKAGIMS